MIYVVIPLCIRYIRLFVYLQCRKGYTLAHIEDTNLILVTTSSTCNQCDDETHIDLGLEHVELNYILSNITSISTFKNIVLRLWLPRSSFLH